MAARDAPQRIDPRRNNSRDLLTAAATKAFATGGFASARSRDIAAQAGVPASLITYYFGSKEGLWEECAQAIFKAAIKRIEEVMTHSQGLDARTRLKVLLREYAYASQSSENSQFIFRAFLEPLPALSEKTRSAYRELREAQFAAIGQLQADGALPAKHKPIYLHALLVGAATSLFSSPYYSSDIPKHESNIETLKEHLDALFDCIGLT